MRFPIIKRKKPSVRTVRAFAGLNTLGRIAENEFAEAENVGFDNYPALSVRPKRGTLASIGSGKATLFSNGGLGWITGSNTLYHRGSSVSDPVFGSYQPSERTCVNMGTKVLFFPDRTYFDTATGECGTLFENFVCGPYAHADVGLIFEDGEPAASFSWGPTAPASPVNNAVYYYQDDAGTHAYRYNEYGDSKWYPLTRALYKFTHAELPGGFREGDTLTIDNSNAGVFDGVYTVAGTGEGYLVLAAPPLEIIFNQMLTGGALGGYKAGFYGRIQRRVPSASIACVCGNRVWAASADGHEIYASKLGDPFNWYTFEDLASDSYAVTVGSDGGFTACAAYGGKPVFFKSDRMIRIFGDKPSNFSLTESLCHGVAADSRRSVALCDDVMIYLGDDGVYLYGGASPVCVSGKLLAEAPHAGVGACMSGKYYLSAANAAGKRRLYVYDLTRKFWTAEDGDGVCDIISAGADVFLAVYADGTSSLVSVRGAAAVGDASGNYITGGTAETAVPWRAVTGRFFVTEPFGRRISRIWLSLNMPEGSVVKVRAVYDHGTAGSAVRSYTCTRSGMKKISFAPRRCECFSLYLDGKGECELLGVSIESVDCSI